MLDEIATRYGSGSWAKARNLSITSPALYQLSWKTLMSGPIDKAKNYLKKAVRERSNIILWLF